MQRTSILFLTALVAVPLLTWAASAPPGSPDGMQIFLAQNCNTCHSVSSAGIEHKMKSSKAPDLTNVAAQQETATLVKYLKKEAQLNGKKHPNPRTLTLSDEELTSLAGWLRDQKSDKK